MSTEHERLMEEEALQRWEDTFGPFNDAPGTPDEWRDAPRMWEQSR